jgi:hypothetical protein
MAHAFESPATFGLRPIAARPGLFAPDGRG